MTLFNKIYELIDNQDETGIWEKINDGYSLFIQNKELMTPVSLIAKEYGSSKVEFLIENFYDELGGLLLINSISGYALGGRDNDVYNLIQHFGYSSFIQHKLIDEALKIYAYTGQNESFIKEYTKTESNLFSVVHGYARVKNEIRISEVFEEHKEKFNDETYFDLLRAQCWGFAEANFDEGVNQTIEQMKVEAAENQEKSNSLRRSAVFVYAAIGEHEKIKNYINDADPVEKEELMVAAVHGYIRADDIEKVNEILKETPSIAIFLGAMGGYASINYKKEILNLIEKSNPIHMPLLIKEAVFSSIEFEFSIEKLIIDLPGNKKVIANLFAIKKYIENEKIEKAKEIFDFSGLISIKLSDFALLFFYIRDYFHNAFQGLMAEYNDENVDQSQIGEVILELNELIDKYYEADQYEADQKDIMEKLKKEYFIFISPVQLLTMYKKVIEIDVEDKFFKFLIMLINLIEPGEPAIFNQIHALVSFQNIEKLKEIIIDQGHSFFITNEQGQTPIELVSKKNGLSKVEFLIEHFHEGKILISIEIIKGLILGDYNEDVERLIDKWRGDIYEFFLLKETLNYYALTGKGEHFIKFHLEESQGFFLDFILEGYLKGGHKEKIENSIDSFEKKGIKISPDVIINFISSVDRGLHEIYDVIEKLQKEYPEDNLLEKLVIGFVNYRKGNEIFQLIHNTEDENIKFDLLNTATEEYARAGNLKGVAEILKFLEKIGNKDRKQLNVVLKAISGYARIGWVRKIDLLNLFLKNEYQNIYNDLDELHMYQNVLKIYVRNFFSKKADNLLGFFKDVDIDKLNSMVCAGAEMYLQLDQRKIALKFLEDWGVGIEQLKNLAEKQYISQNCYNQLNSILGNNQKSGIFHGNNRNIMLAPQQQDLSKDDLVLIENDTAMTRARSASI